MQPATSAELLSFAIYVCGSLAIVGAMVGLSYVLGQRHAERATGEPYESGILATGSARLRISARFYLIAMFFVIFDLEAVFLFAWAIAVTEVGWTGFVEVSLFVAILLLALAYLWRSGALDFGRETRRTVSDERMTSR